MVGMEDVRGLEDVRVGIVVSIPRDAYTFL